MPLVPTTSLGITIAVPGFTPMGGSAGGTITFTGTSGAEKTTWGSLARMQEILEATSLGESHRTRVRQGLEDLEPVDVSFYFAAGGGATVGNAAATSTTADANITRALNYAYAQGAAVTSVHTYASGHTITVEWLVEKITLDAEVAENVMMTAHLVPNGVWTWAS